MKDKKTMSAIISNMKKTWKYAKEQKKSLIIYALISVVICVVGAIVPFFTAKVLLNLTNGFFQQMIYAAILVFLFEIILELGHFLTGKNMQKFYIHSALELRFNLAKETMKLKIKEIDSNSSGVFIDRVSSDAGKMVDIFPNITWNFINVITNLGVFVSIFFINVYLAAYMVFRMLAVYFIDQIRLLKYWQINKEYREIAEKNTGFIAELIRGIRDIKVLNVTNIFLNKMRDKLIKSSNEQYRMQDITRKYNLLAGVVHRVLDFGFLIVGIYLCKFQLLSIASFVILYTYRDKVDALLQSIIHLQENMKEFNLSSNRVFDILENNSFEKEKFGTKKLSKANGDIEFKNVSFSYNENTPVLKNVSFQINANQTVSFVGRSGAGKSTIFSLIARLYDVDSGEITLDGIPVKELDGDSLRNNITIITQNPYLFHFSIRQNLKLVKDDLSEEEMIHICKLAHIHDFIVSLPNGYDTLIGEGGYTLSGGQRQRLAIARALLQKTEIILFDEATSALDNETQLEIQNAINNLKNEYTILIIAHRLSTVIDSDKIILIDHGEVIGEGTHKKLIRNNKVYKLLYQKELK